MENNFCAEQAINCTNSNSTKNVCIKEETNMDNNLIQQGTGSTDSIKVHNNEGKAFGFRAEPARNLMDAYSNKESSIIDGIISQGLTVLVGRNGSDISSLVLDMGMPSTYPQGSQGKEPMPGWKPCWMALPLKIWMLHARLDAAGQNSMKP